MAGMRKPAGGKPVQVVAIEPLRAGGKWHQPGQTVTLPQEAADELVAMGHASLNAATDAKTDPVPPEEPPPVQQPPLV